MNGFLARCGYVFEGQLLELLWFFRHKLKNQQLDKGECDFNSGEVKIHHQGVSYHFIDAQGGRLFNCIAVCVTELEPHFCILGLIGGNLNHISVF